MTKKTVVFKKLSDETKVVNLPSFEGSEVEVYSKLSIYAQQKESRLLEKKYPNRKNDDNQQTYFEMEAAIPYIKGWNFTDGEGNRLDVSVDVLKEFPTADFLAIMEVINVKKD